MHDLEEFFYTRFFSAWGFLNSQGAAFKLFFLGFAVMFQAL
jgi:hypothetical protein